MATRRADGTPQMSPVLATIDAEGAVVVSSRQLAYKVRNLRRDPHAALCVFPDSFYGDWVQVDGLADIVELPEAMDGLVGYFRSISGEHPDWDDYRAAMQRERRVLLRVRVDRAGPNRQG
jgi:PPOX class probable F420-dependent enzyme